ncbi:MAG: hypothetical protein O6837_00155 [Deltaproteobacteria bacterium]|nr:hypothetical protein [Deltaproteobacteria bacterium]
MKDTSAGMERKFREIVLERSGEERLKMGCSMHSAARALVKASISEKDPIAVNRALFLRFYGGEFEPKERKKILLAVRNAVEHKGKQRSKVKEEAQKIFRR